MAEFDQRWIRRASSGFKSASSKHSMCDVCGDVPRCNLPRDPETCDVFIPVIGFRDTTGLCNKTFNTFRRGLGWYRRAPVGTPIRLYANSLEEFVGDGRIVETFQGSLGSLLEQHAAMNHLMIQEDVFAAEARLLRILIQLYGRNYAQPASVFSVLYVERKQ